MTPSGSWDHRGVAISQPYRPQRSQRVIAAEGSSAGRALTDPLVVLLDLLLHDGVAILDHRDRAEHPAVHEPDATGAVQPTTRATMTPSDAIAAVALIVSVVTFFLSHRSQTASAERPVLVFSPVPPPVAALGPPGADSRSTRVFLSPPDPLILTIVSCRRSAFSKSSSGSCSSGEGDALQAFAFM